MNSTYYNNLREEVLCHSESNEWEEAVKEWEVKDVIEDDNLHSSCICGKENLRYLFTIENRYNGNTLYPIGSSCIKKFERDDLNEEVRVKEQFFELLHAVEENEFIELSSKYFSRKLLGYLFEIGAFQSTKYDPKDTYEFMLKMFNRRKEWENGEKRKVSAIILNSIKPYLREYLKNKTYKL